MNSNIPIFQFALAKQVVTTGKLPVLNCGPCPFCWPYAWGQYDIYSVGLACRLTGTELKPGVCLLRHCTIDHHIKHLLENL